MSEGLQIHPAFEQALRDLVGERIEHVKVGTIALDGWEDGPGGGRGRGFMLFELCIGGKLLCFEIAKYGDQGGRACIMSKDEVDDAGVFPLRERKPRKDSDGA